ncbi:MAG: LemA family protein [Alphaproteobacteria bacterium]|nr:LemA family protein [Alphaproteobacteria bacterium]
MDTVLNFWPLILLIVIALMTVTMYNRLIALRQSRNNAFSDIDVQLRQRYDLVPQLVETVKGYAAHEKTTFENVTQARAAVGKATGSGEGRMQAEGMLGSALMSLFAVAENYPQLKADQNFQQLMAELSDIENKIAAARRFFNSATNEYNTVVQQFPSNLIAGVFNFKTEPFFEIEEHLKDAVKTAPDVKFT